MKKMVTEQALGDSIRPSSTAAYSSSASQQQIIPSPANGPSNNKFLVLKRMNKLGKKADKFANGVREHVRLGAKITEIVKGKLSLGARILRVGGMNKVFKKLFNVEEGERLLKTWQCYLSTTAGPIAGLLFISTKNIAFCSERSIKLSSPNGDLLRIHYKVLIPVEKITSVNQSENVKKPSEKYMEIVTVDHFDFWFMGFLNYHKAFNQLQHTISQLPGEGIDQHKRRGGVDLARKAVSVDRVVVVVSPGISKRRRRRKSMVLLKGHSMTLRSFSAYKKEKQQFFESNSKMVWNLEEEVVKVFKKVRLGTKMSETVTGKLSLGARIVKVGGVDKIFNNLFSVKEGEKLLKACQCYLSTTAGPIAGLLFISTDKVAFCGETSLKFYSSNGELLRLNYKRSTCPPVAGESSGFLQIGGGNAGFLRSGGTRHHTDAMEVELPSVEATIDGGLH
ncbi:hypothetical protein EZV62_018149 [Acer yangbiense]|uniref:GRAM domain-containing protein n=1 Tax=Acer yangbiense TaxID=1000413 RepID=A0A5C7HKS0_9ROSI|nr:hypothetical protein EZV62_018149 [Acer yangbiense]